MALSLCNTTTNEHGRELIEHGTVLFPVACYDDDLIKKAFLVIGMMNWKHSYSFIRHCINCCWNKKIYSKAR